MIHTFHTETAHLVVTHREKRNDLCIQTTDSYSPIALDGAVGPLGTAVLVLRWQASQDRSTLGLTGCSSVSQNHRILKHLEQTLLHWRFSITVDRWQLGNEAYYLTFIIHSFQPWQIQNAPPPPPPGQLHFIPLQQLDATTIKFKSYNEHDTMWNDYYTHTLNKQSFVDNMHNGGELPASCAILWSNEVHNLVVCHTMKSGRKVIGFQRHFLQPTGKKKKAGCFYLITPLCQTTWCYTQQDNQFRASFFPTMMPMWSKKMTFWDKNRMLILHHLEWHLTLLPVNRKYITFRL